jgi:predicted TIM-barrel fold metal-dependent hydrolase
MDDQKLVYPLLEVLRKHSVKNVCVHMGNMRGHNLGASEVTVRPAVLVRAAADFPDLNFIAFHGVYPYENELVELVKKSNIKNLYVEIGGCMYVYMHDGPARFAEMLGVLLKGLGTDHVIWGTDCPTTGGPQWQIQTFQAFQFPERWVEEKGFPLLTKSVKDQIFGGNLARLYSIDVTNARSAVQKDLLYKLREEALPRVEFNPLTARL